MTRRIALAILVCVWVMLIAGGLVAYLTTRSVLLEDLDDALTARAAAVPELASPSVAPAVPTSPAVPVPPATGPSERSDRRYVVSNERGQIIGRAWADDALVGPPQRLGAAFTRLAGGERGRTVTVRLRLKPARSGGPPAVVIVTYGDSAESFDRLLNRLAVALIAFGLVAGVVAAAVAWRVSRLALRPLEGTVREIAAIDERKLDRRVDASRLPPELSPMAERLNELLARLQVAFAQRNRFLADASHELRTPVAALVTALEVSLGRPRDAEAYRRTLGHCLDDARELRHLVERLMEQVRSDRLEHDEPLQTLDVAGLLDACTQMVEPLAAAKGVRLVRAYSAPLPFPTRPSRLRSVVMNLVSNAIEYNRPGGCVEVSCAFTPSPEGLPAGTTTTSELAVRVSDTGIGIPAEHLPQLFEPFYRVDASRRHDAGHLGLGLFLVQTHVKALGGTCRVESTAGEGTTYFLNFPAQGGGVELEAGGAKGAGHSAAAGSIACAPGVGHGVDPGVG